MSLWILPAELCGAHEHGGVGQVHAGPGACGGGIVRLRAQHKQSIINPLLIHFHIGLAAPEKKICAQLLQINTFSL
jgi:hypothetical protein